MNENTLEQAIIQHFTETGLPYTHGSEIHKLQSEVILEDELRLYLKTAYPVLTENEINSVILRLKNLSAGDLYKSNKTILTWIAEGITLKRDDPKEKDLFIRLVDFSPEDRNLYRIVNQFEITGTVKRIPDVILFINGLPLVVFELKTPVKEYVTLEDAYIQLTVRYQRDIPELFKYHALLVISDGVNSKYGSLFTPYEYFYTWRQKNAASPEVKGGFATLYTLLEGLLNKDTLRNIIHNYIYFPDTPAYSEKLICRYPQYFAAEALHQNIKNHMKPEGNGKGGTYFGATGSGKSYTMLFLTRLLMRDPELKNPTILLITDRTDLDHQLSEKFTNAKGYIGDAAIRNITSRDKLREELTERPSGGVFLTTVQKFAETDTLLCDRTNIICISDEAHRSQLNLDMKLTETKDGNLQKTFGFAKYLRDALPNATYVGFTGTPIDETLEVFGEVVDMYTMQESVNDGITVKIVYEGRAAKVILDNNILKSIEKYYIACKNKGSSSYEIDQSKKDTANLEAILADPDRLKAVAQDFVNHYESRVKEKSTVKGKAMFVSSSREIAWKLYKEILKLRPEWAVPISTKTKTGKDSTPIPKINLVMTRSKDDEKELYDLLGTKEYREELDRIFKDENSNFKIAIVVDMWITGFDVPSLDTMYIDKPIQEHTLIQTISRVNRVFEGKDSGLVVDYIGIKNKMNKALSHYSRGSAGNGFTDIDKFIKIVRDELEVLGKIFFNFNQSKYYSGTPKEQIKTLNKAVEYVLTTEDRENRFMFSARKMKIAYNVCQSSDTFTLHERDTIHFYSAVRGVILKLNKGDAPDITQMNKHVQAMIEEAIKSDGVVALFNNGQEGTLQIDIFSEDYLRKIQKIKAPNTKIKLLEQLLKKQINEYKKVNKIKAIDFTKRMNELVDRYNDRSEKDLEIQEEVANQIMDVILDVINAKKNHEKLGISFEEEAFYDILKQTAVNYKFAYPQDKMLHLAKKIKELIDDKSKFTDWSVKNDIKAEMKVELRILLDENGYPPEPIDEVFSEVLEQAENFKKYN